MKQLSSRLGRMVLASVLALAAGGAVAQDCTPVSEFQTLTPGVLKIVGPDLPPYFTNDNGELGGYEGAFLARFAKDNCLTVEVTILPAGSVIEAIRNRQGDVGAGGWTTNAARGEVIGQSDALVKKPLVIVGRDPQSSIEAYAGKRIGTVTGYDFNADLEAWANGDAKAVVKVYDAPDAGIADLRTKRLDAMILALINAEYRLKQFPDSGLSTAVIKPFDPIPAFKGDQVSNVIHTRDNPGLTAALNAEIATVIKDGTLATILQNNGLPEILVP